MSRRFTVQPSARLPAADTEEELTVQFGAAVSRRFLELGAEGRRGSPEAVAFGVLTADLRAAQGLGRTAMAVRARLNPVYLSMLEMGLLGPDEIPPVAVAKVAVAVGRRLKELPVLPYPAGEEPGDVSELEDLGVRLYLGIRTLGPWVDAMLHRAEAVLGPARVDLPRVPLPAAEGDIEVSDLHLSNSPLAGPASDEYSFQVVRSRTDGRAPTWWVHARAAPGCALELQIGSQRRSAIGDSAGRLRFEDIEPEDIEPLKLAPIA
jgi:hypothetical protein